MGKKSEEPTLLDELEAALKKDLIEVNTPVAHGEPKPSLTDKMKVYDRVLKLAAIRAKLKDDEWGAGFADDE